MSEPEYQVEFVSYEQWRAAHSPGWEGGDWTAQQTLARLATERAVMMAVVGETLHWECPGCGSKYVARLGGEPLSGWDNPQWVLTGERPHYSATPSLGCPNWKAGNCDGHWWLRDGKLVKA